MAGMTSPAGPTSLLNNKEIRELKSRAQHLKPHLKIGKAGVTPGVIQALNELLSIHELVKVKFDEFKTERKTISPELARLSCSQLIWQVGHVTVLFRKKPVAVRSGTA